MSLDGVDKKEIPTCNFGIKSFNPTSYELNLIKYDKYYNTHI